MSSKISLLCLLLLGMHYVASSQTMNFLYSDVYEHGFTFSGWNNASAGRIYMADLNGSATITKNVGTWNLTSFEVSERSGVNSYRVESNNGDSMDFDGNSGTVTLNWSDVTTITFTRLSGSASAEYFRSFAYTVDPAANPVVTFSVTQPTIAENGGTSNLTATLSVPATSTETITVSYRGSATNGIDYTGSTTITISAGSTSGFTVITGTDDTRDDDDETIEIILDRTTNATAVDFFETATITIADNDLPPVISVDDVTVNEGGGSAFVTISMNRESNNTVSADYSTSNVTAIAGTDYTFASGEVSFSPDDISETVTIPIANDPLDEDEETFELTLSNPSNGSLGDATGAITITDNDPAPTVTLSLQGSPLAENGGEATVVVTIDAASSKTVSGTISVNGSSTATITEDYTLSGTSFVINPGDTEDMITITGVDDAIVEGDETVVIDLDMITNANEAAPQQVTATILNDDNAFFSVNDPDVTEGDAGSATLTFTVSLSAPAPAGGATVDYDISDGTASSSSDYTTIGATTMSFLVGEDSKTIAVTISGDEVVEADETITLTLSNPTGTDVSIDDAIGSGTITNDDQAEIIIANVNGNEDNGAITVTATVDIAVQGGFELNVSTTDGSATTADNDYTAVTNQKLTFSGTAGEQETFEVTPTTDATVEFDETVLVSMSDLVVPTGISGSDIDITDEATVTITNDDDALFSVDDPSVAEGDAGTADLTFTVTLSEPAPAGGATVDYATSDGTAFSASDYTATSGTLNFSVGESSRTVDVTVNGDNVVEEDETVTLNLSDPTGMFVAIGDPTGTGTITNDDDALFSVDDPSVAEGDAGTADLTFTVTLSEPAPADGATVDYATSDGTATAGSDYIATTGTLNFSTGESSKTVTVTVNGDNTAEEDETVILNLSNPIGTAVAIGEGTGTGAIINDDTSPIVQSIALEGAVRANATSVAFAVTFDRNVNSVSPNDFVLTTTGSATGTVASVSASSGSSMTVTVNSISGMGTIRLDLKGDTDIVDDDMNGNVPAKTGDEAHNVISIVINEVDADQAGTDNLEFIELYALSGGSVPLDGLSIVLFNGSDDRSYSAYDLDGLSTNSNGYFVAGTVGVSNVDLVFSEAENNVQNGADAVTLYIADAVDFPNDTDINPVGLVDALVYGTNDSDDSGLLSELGETTQYNEDEKDRGGFHSNSRTPDGTGTFVAQPPTPGATNDLTPPEVIAEISDVSAVYGDADITFSVHPNFEDAQTDDTDLTYTVTNTDNTVVTTSTISSVDGNLTLTLGVSGTSMVTVEASDGTSSVSDDFMVTVDRSVPNITFDNETSVSIEDGPANPSTLQLVARSDADDTNTSEITFSLVSGPAELNDNTLTFGDTFGRVRVRAVQTESANYSQGTAFQNIIVRRPRIRVGQVEFVEFENPNNDYGSRGYSVSADDLVGDVTITAPDELEVSTNGTDFGPSVTLGRTENGNDLEGEPVSVFVRLASIPSAPLDTRYGISHTSSLAVPQMATVRVVLCEDNSESSDVCLIASTASSTSINLRWKPRPGSNVGSYEIWRHTQAPTSDDISPGTLIVEGLPSTTTHYSDESLSPGTIYYYRVRWKNGGE